MQKTLGTLDPSSNAICIEHSGTFGLSPVPTSEELLPWVVNDGTLSWWMAKARDFWITFPMWVWWNDSRDMDRVPIFWSPEAFTSKMLLPPCYNKISFFFSILEMLQPRCYFLSVLVRQHIVQHQMTYTINLPYIIENVCINSIWGKKINFRRTLI